jgi:hypothetical protein
LKRLGTLGEIRLALTQLPVTLDETYERIICSIPPEQQDIAKRTLTLIASGYRITLEGLLDLLAVNLTTRNPSFDRQNRPLDSHTPIEACTCLLTHNVETDVVTLAHYTVKEYLESSRICSGPAKAFHLTDDSIYLLTASCFIVYILYEDYNDEDCLNKPLMVIALDWDISVKRLKSESVVHAIAPLVIQVLDPTRAHFRQLRDRAGWFSLFPMDQGSEKCITLAYLCCFNFLEIAKFFINSQRETIDFEKHLAGHNQPEAHCLLNSSCSESEVTLLDIINGPQTGLETFSLLQIAILMHQTEFVQLFITEGANVNAPSAFGFSLLSTTLSSRDNFWCRRRNWNADLRLTNLLIAHRADPGRIDCIMTSLQSIIERIEVEDLNDEETFLTICQIIRKLLTAGARVNGVACDASNIERIPVTCRYYFGKCAASRCTCLPMEKVDSITALALNERGNSKSYSTPLRMLHEKKTGLVSDMLNEEDQENVDRRIERLEEFLESYGAKSLHLFPIQGLPGYVAEDIEEWEKLKGLDDLPAYAPLQ